MAWEHQHMILGWAGRWATSAAVRICRVHGWSCLLGCGSSQPEMRPLKGPISLQHTEKEHKEVGWEDCAHNAGIPDFSNISFWSQPAQDIYVPAQGLVWVFKPFPWGARVLGVWNRAAVGSDPSFQCLYAVLSSYGQSCDGLTGHM